MGVKEAGRGATLPTETVAGANSGLRTSSICYRYNTKGYKAYQHIRLSHWRQFAAACMSTQELVVHI